MILYKFGFSAFELFHCFLGTVLAYTSTAVPSIKHDNSTFVDQNENLMAFICKYSPNIEVCLTMYYILFFVYSVSFLSCAYLCTRWKYEKDFDCQKLFYYWSVTMKYHRYKKSIVFVIWGKLSRKACLYPRKSTKQRLHNVISLFQILWTYFISSPFR